MLRLHPSPQLRLKFQISVAMNDKGPLYSILILPILHPSIHSHHTSILVNDNDNVIKSYDWTFFVKGRIEPT